MFLRVALLVTVLTLAAGVPQGPPQPALRPAPRSTAAAATPQRSPGNANYRIAARLDPKARTITGDETLTWRNISANATSTLQFHLYYNAWRDADSTWLRESALSGEGRAEIDAEDAGSIDVSSLRMIRNGAETDLTAAIRFIAPDDGNAKDRTVIEVALGPGVSVGPGETIDVQVAWRSHVPRPLARTGARGNFFFIAQWFPKIGVLEDTGWNCHQFHLTTEFFADFGTYDVQLTVPSSWLLGATGLEQSKKDNGDGTTTHRYLQQDVHDFAWTTSPDYIERRERFEHPTLPPVEMRLLLQPEHASQAERHFAATRVALKSYGEWFGPYPVRAHHHRRSRVAERSGRHGISDALHGRHPLVCAGRVERSRRGDGPRGGAPVLVRDRRQQRVRTCLDGRGAEPVLDRAGDGRVQTGSVRGELL